VFVDGVGSSQALNAWQEPYLPLPENKQVPNDAVNQFCTASFPRRAVGSPLVVAAVTRPATRCDDLIGRSVAVEATGEQCVHREVLWLRLRYGSFVRSILRSSIS
jgi:hypothetical protein